jgi:hypothetical protein
MCSWHNVRAQNCDFSSLTFENSEAVGSYFDQANFTNASLVDSDFSRASLRDANLTNADLMGINLRGADLRGANCDGVNFEDADLRGADFSGAKLDQADLQNADIRGAIFDQEIEADQDAEDFTPMFSPQNQKLADAIGPLLVSLLKKGADKELLSEQTEAEFMQELEQKIHLSQSAESPQQEQYDEVIGTLFDHVGNVGISELISSMRDDQDEPSEAVAEMLKGLAKDMQLDESATTEELLEKITKSFR